MLSSKSDALASAPRLGSSTEQTCKICGGRALGFDHIDFHRMCNHERPHALGLSGIPVPYFRCIDCDFLFTNFCDDWTSDDFARWIYNEEYVRVDGEYVDVRPRNNAALMAHKLNGLQQSRILDYGSGTGVFASAMNGHGYPNVTSYDPFAQPQRPTGTFDIVLCFEVVEHSTSPLDTLRDMLSFVRPGGVLIFSQCVQPIDINRIRGTWWYLGPRNGHISTFSLVTLTVIAATLKRRLAVDGVHFMMRDETTDHQFDALAAQFAPVSAVKLHATETAGWHGLESVPSGPFRWTSTSRIEWHIPMVAGDNHFIIPYVDQIASDFAAGCRIAVNGRDCPTSNTGEELIGTSREEQAGYGIVTLRQPPLISPSSRGIPDNRMLGLAIRAK